MREGIIADPERAGEVLAAALDSQNLFGGKLIACVTGFRSIARVLDLPKMDADLLEEAVTREAKREMPVPMEDVHLSWQALDADDGMQRVFSLAVPRDVLDPLLKMMTVAKRRPSAVDIKPLALARLCGEEEAIIGDVEREQRGHNRRHEGHPGHHADGHGPRRRIEATRRASPASATSLPARSSSITTRTARSRWSLRRPSFSPARSPRW